MPILTVTKKGQITLRQDLLKHLGVTPGQKVEVHKLPDGTLTISVNLHDGDVGDFIGCLRRPDTPVISIEEMNETITRGWAEQS